MVQLSMCSLRLHAMWKVLALSSFLLIGKSNCCLFRKPKLTSYSFLARYGVQASDVSIIFDEEDVVVNPGKQLELQCGVAGQYRNCYWEKEDGIIFQVEDVHAKLVSGMSAPGNLIGNECGIVLDSTSESDHGAWMCKIFVIGDALVKSKKVIVTITPSKPKLEISTRPLVVDTSSQQTIACTVAAARPEATISWYLGSEDITHSSKSVHSLTNGDKGIYKTISTLTRQFGPKDHSKRLICSVKHVTLPEPTTDVVDVDVRFPPLPQEPITFYEVKVGTEYHISVNFSSNPPPKYVSWSYGDDEANLNNLINVPGLDVEGRYTATDLILLPNGEYSANLHLKDFTEQDAQRKFSLRVENDLGTTEYLVRLSMDEAPRDSLGSGEVAGIVIVVILVCIIVFVAGYARYNQMYCFAAREDETDKEAPKEPKEEHDTESARAPATNKGQILLKSFNKNISNIKNRLSKTKKPDDVKMSQMEEGTPDEKEMKNGSDKEKKSDQEIETPIPQTDESKSKTDGGQI